MCSAVRATLLAAFTVCLIPIGTAHANRSYLALGRAKAHFTGPGRRHALICLLASAIIALIGTDAVSNPAYKQAASHRLKIGRAHV